MPVSRLPPWIRVRLPTDAVSGEVERSVRELGLHTVCDSAHCPNRHECYGRGTATVMILGNVCTRACRFCAVTDGPLAPPDPGEPERVADAMARLRIEHVVVTSVTRDDLPDGGASVFADTVRAVRRRVPAATIEVLTPDFQGRTADVDTVLAAAPDVFNHNLETVARLQPVVRPQASYTTSLAVLRHAADDGGAACIKSGLMVGLGETDEELTDSMRDLRAAGCELLTLGQYLAPSPAHRPVDRFVPPEQFEAYAAAARGLGFRAVFSGPLVRSSYRAGEMLRTARAAMAEGDA